MMKVLLTLILFTGCLALSEHRAPILTLEPPSRVTFLNSSGISLHCSFIGEPPPSITWVGRDGSALMDVPGLRMSLPNGTLLLLPFSGEAFRQDVHSAVYRCIGSNSAGKTGSRDVRLRAVVHQKYSVQVYDEFVIRGNTAVLRCLLPSFVQDYVVVTSWEREDGYKISSNIATGGRYSVLQNGELHIRNVMLSDGFKKYRCETKHLLSGERQLSSSAAHLIITDPQGTHPPRVTETRSSVHVQENLPTELTCVAQAYPLPDYRWYRKIAGRLQEVQPMSGVVLLSGSFHISKTKVQDSGTYVCVMKNSAGEVRMESTLVVTSPLSAKVGPQRILVGAGRPVTIPCNITGSPVESVTWLKNQRSLSSASGRIRTLSPNVLHIGTVQREDRGVYQCYVSNLQDSVQAATELALGETPPVLLETFKEATLHPGPSISLQCMASGMPLPQVTWSIDGQIVPDNDRVRIGDYVNRKGDVVSHVNISSLRVEDGGQYTCTGTSEVGTVSHSSRINVFGPPTVRSTSDLSAVAGEQAVIICRVAGYPINEIQWQKDGRHLPTNHRQQIFSNGTLLIASVQRSEDEGTYSCIAKNEDGITDQGKIKVRVREKPVMLPFNIPTEIQEGRKVRIICQVASGDRPFKISWLKNDQPLRSLEGVTVNHPDDDISSLTIENATPQHNGRYMCLVKNDVASVNYTMPLTVLVPPRWKLKPSDSGEILGQSVVLHCQVDGYPQPQIRWEKAKEKSSHRYSPISTNYHYQVFENGSLAIRDVTKDDEGFYLCHANNGIGPGLSTVIAFTVHAAPKFDSKFRTNLVKKGEDVSLLCEATGDFPLTVVWMRDKQQFDPASDPRYLLKMSEGKTGIKSELLVPSVGRTDSALYTCVASNNFGTDDTNIQLIVQEPPDPPRDVKIMGTSSRFVRISWDPPFSGNSLITHYFVHYRDISSSSSTLQNATLSATETTSEIGNLHPATSYELCIYAKNPIGLSTSSQPIKFNTDEEVPEAPPEIIDVKAISSQTLLVIFRAPPRILQNGQIKGYYIGYREKNGSETFQYKTVEVRQGFDTTIEAELKSLKKFTEYLVVLQAFNNQGAGPRSDPYLAATMEDVPSMPPQDVKCLPTSPTGIQVVWAPPPKHSLHGILKGFRLFYKEIGDWTDEEERTQKTTKPMILLEQLEKFTNYSIAVLAFTLQGDGLASDPIHCRTLEDVPSQPADIKAMPMATDAILVSWLPPAKPNGVVTQYTLYQRTFNDGSQDTRKLVIAPTQNYFEAQRLQRKRRYEFWLSASTKKGESEHTRVLSQTTSDTISARIASFSQTLLTVRGSVFHLPCKSVGIPLPERKWIYRSELLVAKHGTSILKNGSLVISEATKEHSGNYTCRVVNKYGTDEITYTVNVKARNLGDRVLPAPVSLSITSVTSDSIEIRWKTITKLSKLKGFILRWKREYGLWEEVTIGASETYHVFSNLQCGTVYQFYLTPVGKWGEGESTDVMYKKTNGEAPSAPPRESFLSSNSTSITLHLQAWQESGCPIKSFIIRYKRASLGEWRIYGNSVQPQQERVVLRDLSPGTWYNVRMTAQNGAGSTVAEYDVATLTTDGGTVAPMMVMDVKADIKNLWTDLNIIIPVVAAVTALSVVLGVALCVCIKKRQNSEELYERPLGDGNASQSELQKKGTEVVAARESLYHSCGPKRLSTHSTQLDQQRHQEDSIYYDDDIAPYATFKLPGCDSDTESSYSTSRELQTFGQQHRLMANGPAQDDQISSYQFDRLQKQEYELYRELARNSALLVMREVEAPESWTEDEDDDDYGQGVKSLHRVSHKCLVNLIPPSKSRNGRSSAIESLQEGYADLSEVDCYWHHNAPICTY